MDQLKSAEDLNPSFHDTKDLQNLDALVSDPVEKKNTIHQSERGIKTDSESQLRERSDKPIRSENVQLM